MTHSAGIDGRCIWSYFAGEITQAEWDDYIAHMQRAVDDQRVDVDTALVIVNRSSVPSAQQRQQVAEFMKANAELLKNIKGHAMVTESRLAVGALTALNWLFKKPFKEKVFSRLDDALTWLQQVSDSFDRDKLVRALDECQIDRGGTR